MTESPFTATPEDLVPILAELAQREPIFHRPAFSSISDDFARLMDPSYWEVGASGRRYSRVFVLAHLEANAPGDADALGPDTFLLTYTLAQGDRLTHRATLWQQTAAGWRILYHQGTVVLDPAQVDTPPTRGFAPTDGSPANGDIAQTL